MASVEILSKRLAIQKFNKHIDEKAYMCGDLNDSCIMDGLRDIVDSQKGVDVIIATPPCQGMSIFNHKKKDENQRNSLVVAAMEAVRQMSPKIFIFENVARFFDTACDLQDGRRMTIGAAIDELMGEQYNVSSKVLNLKNYGCPSSRTRALAIGVDKRLRFSPMELFPDWEKERTLREIVGDLPHLARMGEVAPDDIYHSFKPYDKRMRPWISGLGEGRSAFDRESPARRPHKIVGGKRIENKNGNGDKYRRQRWDMVAPCVHTRNDILASQNTVHPSDDRVFSVREVMRMLGVSKDFQWSQNPLSEMSHWDTQQQREFLLKNEPNIRQCLGEAVPPTVILNIARKILSHLTESLGSKKSMLMPGHIAVELVKQAEKGSGEHDIGVLMRAIEQYNERKETHAAYYTPTKTAFKTMEMLPVVTGKKRIRVLEPSVGAGHLLRFLPFALSGYQHVEIDAMDVDERILGLARNLASNYPMPDNVSINFIHGDFLTYPFGEKRYDIIVGNPPFRKTVPQETRQYKRILGCNTLPGNTFAFFMLRALNLARHVAFICPKTVLNAPAYDGLRDIINTHHAVRCICDFGETGFEGVKIETLAMAIETRRKQSDYERVYVESVPRNIVSRPYARDIFAGHLPYWVIYRNEKFDKLMDKMMPGVFSSFRDRQITKRHMHKTGTLRVVKSRNIQSVRALTTEQDVFIKPDETFAAHQYVNREDVFLVPNLSYSPRACYMPKDSIPDGSVAIFYPNDKAITITDKDLEFFATDDFRSFYRVARNYGTRSLNIDANSSFFFGVCR